jgi:hypothetical protein
MLTSLEFVIIILGLIVLFLVVLNTQIAAAKDTKCNRKRDSRGRFTK